jgi:hypothetical protein
MKILNKCKEIPLSLKIVFILSILWIIWAFFSTQMRYEQGLPFFWFHIIGIFAVIVVLLLDILWPIIFLIWVYKKKNWWVKVAYFYISIFVINSIFALFTVSKELWIMPILIPAIVYTIFWMVIYKNKKYFK